MVIKRVNVLVYAGNGSTVESVRHCLFTLRRLLSPNYAIIPISHQSLLTEPWTATCALLVFPGGADLAYCRTLNGDGNRKISQYVNRGGAYLGFCAGGYYGSQRCEFEVGDPRMEVVGARELAFFPGTCRGLAFPGFVYGSEAGALAVELKVNREALGPETISKEVFRSYYNGGGVFVDAEKCREQGVEVLASYTEKLNVEAGEAKAAVVYRKIGEGNIILTGPHPEFAGINLDKKNGGPDYSKVVDAVNENDIARSDFLKACLRKLGLKIAKEETPVPSLSRLHLSSHNASDVSELVHSWNEIITTVDGEEYIKGENDTFHLEKPAAWSMGSLKKAVSAVLPSSTTGSATESSDDSDASSGDRIIDYNSVLKRLLAHETELPANKETPFFNHHAFYANLNHYVRTSRDIEGEFGKYLLYGEVVTSTNTMLEKNNKLLNLLPTGFTMTATTQLCGRGRGSNVWVSPSGSLVFSTVLRHPMSLTVTAPVVFVQYLAALAIVRGIHTYEPGYSKIPVRLKWPNDIYALAPPSPDEKKGPYGLSRRNSNPVPSDFVKIGGILVNSSYVGNEYTLVVGIGLNTANHAPTTSLNALAAAERLPPFQMEKLLARILTCFESIYTRFRLTGWNTELEALYLQHWLHSDQIVTLETEGGVKARIRGVTRDWGLLLAEELGWQDRPTGKLVSLQSDSNSFDFFKGLVKRKI
ncbi:class II aaRS and biotin synthetase [Aulographum hederae CBS 113979]|uniref:Class II aaRS and biotin synthetase n=1 Tax=Aulographum hederae CBS 113979 TaxID=1176131 RepID=A0A6G1H1A1_9PEZI|nr:class II aaRS and biotin synthetase [Aulographum hederae CBS 113979]